MGKDKADATNASAGEKPQTEDAILASVDRLIATGREAAEAELTWIRLKALRIVKLLRRGIIFATIATACLIVGFMMLLVAGVVALTPFTGLLAATLIVAVAALLGTLLFGLTARRILNGLIRGDEL